MDEVNFDDIENGLKSQKDVSSSNMTFLNISYTLQEKPCCCPCFRKSVPKTILNDISGAMKQGINAIMGATGSGKTSLLDVLANRKDPKWLQGTVLLNGKKLPKNYKHISGYVMQDDNLLGTMTVAECLWFSANMRLPSSTTHAVKKARIEELLEQLGLQSCSETKIGNEYIRGISGGERKRTSIGVELITQPSVLFLDEPTSGLDASTALEVVQLLKSISSAGGQMIVLSIHQPNFRIFRLFDSLTLLAHGLCVYHGEAQDSVLEYFERLGYMYEVHNSPGDFLLDVTQGNIARDSANGNLVHCDNNNESKDGKRLKISQNLNKQFLDSDLYSVLKTNLQALSDAKPEKNKCSPISHERNGLVKQTRYLLKRDFVNILRNPQGLLGNIFINAIIALIFGAIYFQLDNSPISGSQNRFGILFFVTTNLMFGCINVIDMLMKNRKLFIHEYVSGYYSTISYFVSKVLGDVIPMRTMAPIAYTAVTYWMAGLKSDYASCLTFLLFSVLTGYAAVSVSMFFSVTVQTFSVASLLVVLVFIFSLVFSGLLVNVSTIPKWLSWLQYLSIARFSILGLSINEFKNLSLTECFSIKTQARKELCIFYDSTNVTNDTTCILVNGESFLNSELSVNLPLTTWSLWQNAMALCAIIVGMFFLTYVQLVRMKKYS